MPGPRAGPLQGGPGVCWGGLRLLIVAALAASACSTSTQPRTPSASPRSALDALKARGVLVIALRMELPPGGQNLNDPAHAQKRAFEAKIGELLARQIIGPSAKVEVRSAGQDRLSLVVKGDADVAMTITGPAGGTLSLSQPLAATGIALATPKGSTVRGLSDLAGRTIAIAPNELMSADDFAKLLQARNVQARIMNFPGLRAAVQAVEAGQAAAVAGDKTGLLVLARDLPDLVVVATLDRRAFVVGVRKDAPDLLQAVNGALAVLRSSREIERAAEQAALPYEAP